MTHKLALQAGISVVQVLVEYLGVSFHGLLDGVIVSEPSARDYFSTTGILTVA